MPTPRHLREAPILEAIIDLRVRARQGFQPKEFGRLKGQLSDRFPRVIEQHSGTVTFQFTPTGVQPPVAEDRGFQGFIFGSSDEKIRAQFRIDGFTLNRIKPYTSWDQLFPLALELWKLYCSVANPEAVTRLALRYINHIVLPADMGDFDEYLMMAPAVPAELPQAVSAFFTRTTIHDPDRGLAAHVAQAFGTASEARNTLILDIDAFREGRWAPADPEIEATLGQLRVLKNLIFFNSLTEKTLRKLE
jgi:uncharacterized protein (TIGR04255 family)